MDKNKLKKYILDPKHGYIGDDKLYRKLNKKVPLKEIHDITENLQPYQINRTKKIKNYNTIVASYVGDIIQADLMDMSNFSINNRGIKFLLTFIDIYSRYVFVEPLKNKQMTTVKNAMERIINKFNNKIKNITTDDGKEFNNNKMKKLLNDNDIKHWITPAGTPNKLSIIERFHRTLRNKMNLYFSANRTNKYIDDLQNIIDNYNETYHRTIKSTPKDIYEGKSYNKQDIIKNEYDLNEGDTVRRIIKKGTFDKGNSKYSDTLYIIDEVHNNSYTIKNKNNGNKLKRRYMGYELKKVNINDNIEDNYDKELKNINRNRRRQKMEHAFNDKNTHKIDDYGNVEIIRRHLIPKDKKRIPKKINRF